MADTNPPAPAAHQSGEYPAAQPHDIRDHSIKATVAYSIIAALAGSILTAGVVWGQSSTKLDNTAKEASESTTKNADQDKQLTELKIIATQLAEQSKSAKEAAEKAEKANADQHAELKKQLDRMESKIDKK